MAYTYDQNGGRLTVSLDGTLHLTYGYDDASRLTSLTRGSAVFGFGYDIINRRTSMTYPNGVTTLYVYDDLSRLLSVGARHASPLQPPITSFDYTYDNAGNRTRKAALEYSEDYAYDLLYRLTGVDRGGAQTRRERFGYDAVGNRLVEQVASNVTSATYNEKNQLLSRQGGGRMRWRGQLDEAGNVAFTTATVNGQPARMLAGNVFEADLDMQAGTNAVTLRAVDASGNVTTRTYSVNVMSDGATYTYDANGNLSTKTTGSDTWAYTWNAENQLTRVTKNGAEMATFKYDPVGRRVEKVAAGVTTTWAYDGEDILREMRGGITTTYIHGPGIDEPLARVDQAGNTSYLHADGLGSIVKETNSAGAVTLTRQYDAWGNLEQGADQPGYAFTGREWDPETGLYYYRARYYDPKVGRFISEDPIGFEEGVNFFQYTRSKPTMGTDPLGLSFWSSFGRGVLEGAITTAVVVGTAAAIVAVAPAAAAAVTGTLMVVGAVGIVGAVASVVADPSEDNVGYTLGSLTGSALVGGASGKALAKQLSPPGYEPPIETPSLLKGTLENAWRGDGGNGRISPSAFMRDWLYGNPNGINPMQTGPETWAARFTLAGAGLLPNWARPLRRLQGC